MNLSRNNIAGLLPYLWLLVIFASVIVLYFPVIGYGWLTGPDQNLIIDNALIYNLSGSKLYEMFFSSVDGKYQPLGMLSLAIDISLTPVSAFRLIHIMNIVIHLLNIALVFRFVHLVSDRWIAAVLVAILFAIHPLQTESIVMMSSRSTLLATFFFLMALLSYLYAIRSRLGRRLHYRMSIVFFVLSCFTHPFAIIFPFIAILLDKFVGIDLKTATTKKIPLFIISLIFIFIGLYAQWQLSGQGSAGVATDKFLYLPHTIVLLLRDTIIPYKLSVYHPYPDSFQLINVLLSTIPMILIGLMIWFMRKDKLIKFSVIFFLCLMIISALFSWSETYMYSETEFYTAGIAVYLIIGITIDRLITKLSMRISILTYVIIFVIVGIGFVGLGYISYERIILYEDGDQLWTDVITKYPEDDHAYFMRGDHFAINAYFEKAKFDYQQCIRRNPGAYRANNNLGLIYMQEGDLPLAIAEYSRSIKANDRFYKSYLNRGIARMRLGKHEQALEDMNRAVSLKPGESLVYYNRGLVYERMGLLPDAIKDLSSAIDRNPNMYIFYKDRGKAYVWNGDFHLAEGDFSTALEMDPTDSEMWFRRSLVRTSQDKFSAALEDALMARSLGFPVEEEYIKGITVQALQDDLPESDN